MNLIRVGSRLLSRTSPMLLLATGAAAALSLPPVRRRLRSAAVTATKGALVVADRVKDIRGKMREKVENVAAREGVEEHCSTAKVKENFNSFRNKLKARRRRIAVAATAGVLAVSDKAKSVREEFKEIIDEAKASRQRHSTHTNEELRSPEIASIGDDLEAVDTNMIHERPRRRRVAARRLNKY